MDDLLNERPEAETGLGMVRATLRLIEAQRRLAEPLALHDGVTVQCGAVGLGRVRCSLTEAHDGAHVHTSPNGVLVWDD